MSQLPVSLASCLPSQDKPLEKRHAAYAQKTLDRTLDLLIANQRLSIGQAGPDQLGATGGFGFKPLIGSGTGGFQLPPIIISSEEHTVEEPAEKQGTYEILGEITAQDLQVLLQQPIRHLLIEDDGSKESDPCALRRPKPTRQLPLRTSPPEMLDMWAGSIATRMRPKSFSLRLVKQVFTLWRSIAATAAVGRNQAAAAAAAAKRRSSRRSPSQRSPDGLRSNCSDPEELRLRRRDSLMRRQLLMEDPGYMDRQINELRHGKALPPLRDALEKRGSRDDPASSSRSSRFAPQLRREKELVRLSGSISLPNLEHRTSCMPAAAPAPVDIGSASKSRSSESHPSLAGVGGLLRSNRKGDDSVHVSLVRSLRHLMQRSASALRQDQICEGRAVPQQGAGGGRAPR